MNLKRILLVLPIIGLLAACTSAPAQQSASSKTQAAAESNQQKLLTSTPIPILEVSQERENLVKRAKRINVQNMSSCITLFAENGSVVAFFPVAGKVSSLNSYLLPGDAVEVQKDWYASSGQWALTREAPDIDGAYGMNADGIFFFTADTDAYVEWKGSYFWSDACLSPAAPTLLVQVTAPVPETAGTPKK